MLVIVLSPLTCAVPCYILWLLQAFAHRNTITYEKPVTPTFYPYDVLVRFVYFGVWATLFVLSSFTIPSLPLSMISGLIFYIFSTSSRPSPGHNIPPPPQDVGVDFNSVGYLTRLGEDSPMPDTVTPDYEVAASGTRNTMLE